jgi:hypothetical protein
MNKKIKTNAIHYFAVGAVRILCDINEYLKCVREFKIQIITDIYETLKSLCNLFYELPKDLNRIFNHTDLVNKPKYTSMI